MRFEVFGQTITEVVPYLYQGAAPSPETDWHEYGLGVRVYVTCAELRPEWLCYRGCEVVFIPLADNPGDAAEWPPKIIGAPLDAVVRHAEDIAARVRAGKKTVSLCFWGYNRSGLLTGLAMRKLGYSFEDTLRIMRTSRGPHPRNFGEALNNNNFRETVRRNP